MSEWSECVTLLIRRVYRSAPIERLGTPKKES
jgi:hypothetical protein